MRTEFSIEEFEKKLAELEGFLRIRDHGYNVKDPELEKYFEEKEDDIVEYLNAEYESAVEVEDEDRKADILEQFELLGYGAPDL